MGLIDGTRLRCLTLDVTSRMGAIKQRMDEALAIWGRIDVLVNNAGRITYGASEELEYVFKITPGAWAVKHQHADSYRRWNYD
jgi:NAD(P)-dependent dehydrogenase (short-subunit alcohol dehydrogenase family)